MHKPLLSYSDLCGFGKYKRLCVYPKSISTYPIETTSSETKWQTLCSSNRHSNWIIKRIFGALPEQCCLPKFNTDGIYPRAFLTNPCHFFCFNTISFVVAYRVLFNIADIPLDKIQMAYFVKQHLFLKTKWGKVVENQKRKLWSRYILVWYRKLEHIQVW